MTNTNSILKNAAKETIPIPRLVQQLSEDVQKRLIPKGSLTKYNVVIEENPILLSMYVTLLMSEELRDPLIQALFDP